MAETVFVLCENGLVMEHDLPLPEGLAQRVTVGEAVLVNEDGSPLSTQDTVPEDTPAAAPPVELAVKKPPVKRAEPKE